MQDNEVGLRANDLNEPGDPGYLIWSVYGEKKEPNGIDQYDEKVFRALYNIEILELDVIGGHIRQVQYEQVTDKMC